MSASGGWGFHLCQPPCLLLYHPCPHSGEFWWVFGPTGVSLLPFVFVTLTFLDVTFLLVVTTFATLPAGDGTPEMILMGRCFPIVSVLLSFRLQQTPTAMVAVRGMTWPSVVIEKFTVDEWGCTGFSFSLIHGTQLIPPLTTTPVGLSGFFRPFSLATFRGRGGTSTQESLEEFVHMGVIIPLKGQFDEQVHKIILRTGWTLLL